MTSSRARISLAIGLIAFALIVAYVIVRPLATYGAGTVSCNYFGTTDGYSLWNTIDLSAFNPPACPAWWSGSYTSVSSYSCSSASTGGSVSLGDGSSAGSLCNFSISVVDPAPPACVPSSGSSCSTATNACGQANFGTYSCTGVCSVSSPPAVVDACPSSPGTQCSVSDPGQSCSASSICGTNTGNYLCSGACSVSAPSVPSNYGTSCPRSNSCGSLTNWGTIDCSGSCNAPAPSEASCAAPSADLTASYLSPTSATAGTVSLSGRVTNGGGTGTGNFTSYFEVQSSGTLTWTSPAISLASGASQTVSANRSFSAGTYQVRICADGTGAVSESNEANNCSGWNTLTVSGAPVVAGVTCSPASQSVSIGGTASWTANPSGSATAPYAWYDSGSTLLGNGSSFSKVMSAAGTYAFHVTANDGSGGTVSSPDCQVTVSGSSCSDGGPVKVNASATRVKSGTTVNLTWTGSNVSAACTLTGPGVTQSIPPSSCSISGGLTTPVLTSQAVYTLSCPGGQKSQVIINIIPAVREI